MCVASAAGSVDIGYLAQTPAAKVTKLLAIRTADPQPFVMPSVCELTAAQEGEKERGY